MRRWLALPLALVLALSGCKGAPPAQRACLPDRYELSGRLRYQGLESQVKLRRDGRDTLEYESPAGLRGLSLTMDPGFLHIRCAGLERRYTRGSLPETSVAAVLLSALDAAQALPGEGECAGGPFLLETAGGNLSKLSVPGRGLELEVQSFRNLDQSG